MLSKRSTIHHRLSLAITRLQRRTRRNLHQPLLLLNPNQARRNPNRPFTTLLILDHSAIRVSEKLRLRPFVRPQRNRNRNQGRQGSHLQYTLHRLVVTSPGPRKPTSGILETETRTQCFRRRRRTETTRTTFRLMSSPSRLRLRLPRRWRTALRTTLPAGTGHTTRPTPSLSSPRRIGA